MIIAKLQKHINLLSSEKQIVGKYLESLDIGAECRIRNTMFIEVGDPVGDENGLMPLGIVDRLPQSQEVMKIYNSGVREKIALLKGYKTTAKK